MILTIRCSCYIIPEISNKIIDGPDHFIIPIPASKYVPELQSIQQLTPIEESSSWIESSKINNLLKERNEKQKKLESYKKQLNQDEIKTLNLF